MLLMLLPSVLPLLVGGRALRRYRAQLQQALHAEPALRLLPNLLALPLGAAPLPDPAAVLAAPSSLALVAGPGGGRSLALLQTAARGADNPRAPAVYLSLAEADRPGLTPRAAVRAALDGAGLPPAIVAAARPCVLLLDDYELLDAGRRAAWRAFVAGLPESWPACRAVVALPPDERWPELRELPLTAPDDAALAAWLAHLLPGRPPEPILAALAAEPLAGLRDSPADLLLLTLTYPLAGLPASRAALYEQAFSLVRPLLPDGDGSTGGVTVGRAVLRHYRLARGLSGGHDLDTLANLPPHELAAVAPLAAGLLDDPCPVLDLLWSQADHPAALRGLAACLRERPSAAPAAGLRLLDRLAADQSPAAAALLQGLADSIPAALAAAVPGAAATTLAAVAGRLGGAGALALAVVDAAGAAPELRWAAADLLARGPAPAGLVDPPDGLDELALAARCFAAAVLPGAYHSRLLAPPLRAGLGALLGGAGGDGRRRSAAGAMLGAADAPAELRALALAATPADADGRALVEDAVADADPGVRRAALAALGSGDPDAALALLTGALAAPGARGAALHDLLDAVAALPVPRAAGLLGRVALASQHELAGRLRAVALLAGRGRDGAAVLLRLLDLPRLPAPLRAAAALHLGRASVAAALPALRAALLREDEPLVRRAAAAALGDLARLPGCRDAALAGLLAALDMPWLDAPFAAAVAAALAACGPAAMPALGDLLAPALADDLRADWLARAPALADASAEQWPALGFPMAARVALHEAMAAGETPADRPGDLVELAERQAAFVARAAADALVELARRRPSLRREAALLLRRALRVGRPPELLAHALDRLGDLLGDNPQLLDALLDGLAGSPQLRWLALDRLGRRPALADPMLRRLQVARDDGFTRAKLIEMLGAQGVGAALFELRAVAESGVADLNQRCCAVAALGRLGAPAAGPLLRLVSDEHTPAAVRAAAATALPAELDPAARRALREVLRPERPPAELAPAALAALGRAADREAMPLLLRYAQSDRPAEALAAIEAMAASGDRSVAPALVPIAHTSTALPGVRLAAVAALLGLCGAEYLPLLRSYLESPSLPIRLRAQGALAALDPGDPRLLAPLADPGAPLALRLDALARLTDGGADDELLPMLLLNRDEEPQLRLAVAAALARSTRPDVVANLSHALREQAPPLLHRRCVDALAALAAGPSAAAEPAKEALAALALDDVAMPERALWAAEALLAKAHS